MQFEQVAPFSDHVAWVKYGGVWGLIDSDGRWLIKPHYADTPSDFHNGTAVIESNSQKYLINKSDQIIIAEGFRAAEPFSNGLALVRRTTRWGFIDDQGNVKIPLNFQRADSFSEGLAAVAVAGPKASNHLLWGFISRDGEFIIPPIYRAAYSFKHGYAIVFTDAGSTLIDRSGAIQLPAGIIDWSAPCIKSELLATDPERKQGRYGFVTTKGVLSIPEQFKAERAEYDKGWLTPGYFSENLAPVRRDWRYGYIDTDGRTVIRHDFDSAEPFSDGLAAVKTWGQYGYIDHQAKFVIRPQYDWADSFSEDRAVVIPHTGGFELRF